jgi:hypothetical protein
MPDAADLETELRTVDMELDEPAAHAMDRAVFESIQITKAKDRKRAPIESRMTVRALP